MLRLRAQQLERLSHERKARFIKRLIGEMSSFWPEEIALIGPDHLPIAVAMLVERAFEYGFRIEYDVARFVTLAFAFRSTKFDSLPWASPILREKDLPPRIRMNSLWD